MKCPKLLRKYRTSKMRKWLSLNISTAQQSGLFFTPLGGEHSLPPVGSGEHSTTAACFKQLQEGWEMAQWILCPPVPGSDIKIPTHHPSAKEVWFSYQQLRQSWNKSALH